MSLNILLVDDHAIVRQGIRQCNVAAELALFRAGFVTYVS